MCPNVNPPQGSFQGPPPPQAPWPHYSFLKYVTIFDYFMRNKNCLIALQVKLFNWKKEKRKKPKTPKKNLPWSTSVRIIQLGTRKLLITRWI